MLVRFTENDQEPRCEYCDSTDLIRLISRPGIVRTRITDDSGKLNSVEPRKAVEHMSRMYDKSGVDPGQGFREVAKRATAGDSPHELKEAIEEVRKKDAADSHSISGSG